MVSLFSLAILPMRRFADLTRQSIIVEYFRGSIVLFARLMTELIYESDLLSFLMIGVSLIWYL